MFRCVVTTESSGDLCVISLIKAVKLFDDFIGGARIFQVGLGRQCFAHRFNKFIWLVWQQDKFGLGKLKNVISI